MKILYIEDTEASITAMKGTARIFDHQVTIALTGAEGYTLAREFWHLICIDIHLPDMNGLTLVRRLRDENINTPIVACTGDLWNYNRRVALEAGCTDFLEKPFTVSDLQSLFARFDV